MTVQPQRNTLWIGNAENPGTLSNSRATGEGSALSRSWPSGINPLHDGTVPKPMGKTTHGCGSGWKAYPCSYEAEQSTSVKDCNIEYQNNQRSWKNGSFGKRIGKISH